MNCNISALIHSARLAMYKGSVFPRNVFIAVRNRLGKRSPKCIYFSNSIVRRLFVTHTGGDVRSLGNLDGMNIWNSLSQDLPSPRTEVVYNIDPIDRDLAIRVGRYKLLFGTTPALQANSDFYDSRKIL